VLKTKGVRVPSVPPAQSPSQPPKAVKEVVVKKKRRRKPDAEELRVADQRRFYKLYSETVSRYGNTLNQLARIR
jgi:hypothetical protein